MKNNRVPKAIERDGTRRPPDGPHKDRRKHKKGCPAANTSNAKNAYCICNEDYRD